MDKNTTSKNSNFKIRLSALNPHIEEQILMMEISDDLPDLENFFDLDKDDIQYLQSQVLNLCLSYIKLGDFEEKILDLVYQDKIQQEKLIKVIFDRYTFINSAILATQKFNTDVSGEENTTQESKHETADEILSEIENPTPSVSNPSVSTLVDEQEIVQESDVMPFEIRPAEIKPRESSPTSTNTIPPQTQAQIANTTTNLTPNPALKISTKINAAMQSSDVRPTETTYYKIDPYRESAE